MKKLITSIVIISALIFIGCSEDNNPTQPTVDPTNTYLTSNIKVEPSFFSLEKMGPVNTFDLVFHIVNRSPDLNLNSGANGSAGVSAKDLGQVDFNAAADVSNGFTEDAAAAAVICDSWYSYH